MRANVAMANTPVNHNRALSPATFCKLRMGNTMPNVAAPASATAKIAGEPSHFRPIGYIPLSSEDVHMLAIGDLVTAA